MSKRMFEILDEMNLDDIKNDTRLVVASYNLLSVKKVKKGSEILMGADDQVFYDLNNEKVIPVLFLINEDELFKRQDATDNKQNKLKKDGK